MFGKLKKQASKLALSAGDMLEEGVTLVKNELEDTDKKEIQQKMKENEEQANLLKSSLDGQDLTFKHAWEAFGVQNAADIFDVIAQTFEGMK